MFKGSNNLYYFMYIVGFAIMMVLNLKSYKRYKVKKGITIVFTLLTYVYGIVGAIIMGAIFTAAARHFGSDEASRVAIFGAVIFTPLLLTVSFRIVGSDCKNSLDMFTPGIFIILTCAKFGCFLEGCCCGFKWDKGIYNPHVEAKVFPVQICEVATMIAIIVLTQLIFKKYKKYVPGTAYPVTAALYSASRFCWEEARYYETEKLSNVFMGLTFWQIWCIFVFVCSVISIIILCKKSHTASSKNPIAA